MTRSVLLGSVLVAVGCGSETSPPDSALVSDGSASAAAVNSSQGDGAADGPLDGAGFEAGAPVHGAADASSFEDAGVNGIYRTCAPVALTQTYSDPAHLSLRYPAGWTGSAAASNSYALIAPYMYLPTGSSAPHTEDARVATLTGITLMSAADAQRAVAETPSGYPGAIVRRFTIGGQPAAAWWYEFPPAQCGACRGPGDPGPDFIAIGVSAVHGLDLVELDGTARIDAPDSVFCEIEAIEGSLTLP